MDGWTMIDWTDEIQKDGLKNVSMGGGRLTGRTDGRRGGEVDTLIGIAAWGILFQETSQWM